MPAPPSRPALRERYDRRQQAVVAAAAHEFAVKGFHATSMQDLIAASGLTAGGLYHYIGSKDQLLVRICDELMEPLLDRVRDISASADPADHQLGHIVRIWLAHVERNRDHMLVFQQERHVLERGPQWRHVRRQREEFEEILAQVLARGQRDGLFELADLDLALRALLGMVNHTAQWYRARGRLTTEQIADGYTDLLLGTGGRREPEHPARA
jgi:TetR/AcrR family transcriptional regulator, cholesterol catabolism regulator